MVKEFIFVYGTLRKHAALTPIARQMQSTLLRHARFYSDGYLQGKMYQLEGYPGAIQSSAPDDKVFGELYSLNDSDKVLPILDRYEGCSKYLPHPHEYRRIKIPIHVNEENSIVAWVYIYNRDVLHLTQIRSGDYLKNFN